MTSAAGRPGITVSPLTDRRHIVSVLARAYSLNLHLGPWAFDVGRRAWVGRADPEVYEKRERVVEGETLQCG